MRKFIGATLILTLLTASCDSEREPLPSITAFPSFSPMTAVDARQSCSAKTTNSMVAQLASVSDLEILRDSGMASLVTGQQWAAYHDPDTRTTQYAIFDFDTGEWRLAAPDELDTELQFHCRFTERDIFQHAEAIDIES